MIKINFSDMYSGFSVETSFFAKFILANFDCELSDRPDYLFVGPYGHRHLRFNCLKIYWTAENDTPNFNLFDYAMGFDHLQFGDRYLRLPLFAVRAAFQHFREGPIPSDEKLLNRQFCSYVVSNSVGDPIRTKFFIELSKYKKVNSGGRYMNNIGGPVDDKMAFVANHKFSIAFENSSYPGYTTEKIMEPMAVWSIPIYWGDPLVHNDFCMDAFLKVKDESDIPRVIENIIKLDNDDDAYLSMCKVWPLVIKTQDFYIEELKKFLGNIFNQPISQAKRIALHGYQDVFYRKLYKKAYQRYDMIDCPINLIKRIRRSFLRPFGLLK